MMQLKRRVVNEAIQIRFFECDLYISHRSDNPFDYFLRGFVRGLSLKARNPSMIA
jgi:hypothetical protein